jgi:hypothetical protein
MSNQSTYHEAWVEWTNVGAGANDSCIAAVQPNIIANVWDSPAVANKICKTVVAGTLINVTASIANTKLSNSGTTYYVDIQQTQGTADTEALV